MSTISSVKWDFTIKATLLGSLLQGKASSWTGRGPGKILDGKQLLSCGC